MHKERNNKIWLLIVTFVTLLLISVGYSFFSDSLNINATGVIGDPPTLKFKDILIDNAGLSLSNIDQRYHFSGMVNNNYIKVNNELWRIISYDVSGNIKIIRNNVLIASDISEIENNSSFWKNNVNDNMLTQIKTSGEIPFDVLGRRPADVTQANSYCISTNQGCNAYAITSYNSKTVTQDSLIKNYIDNVYYDYLSSDAKLMIKEFSIKVGLISSLDGKKDASSVYSYEGSPLYIGNISLANVSDYMLASGDTDCQNNFDSDDCGISNWMTINGYSWYLLDGNDSDSSVCYYVNDNGKIQSTSANDLKYFRPVASIDGNTAASGSGTNSDPYVLEDN